MKSFYNSLNIINETLNSIQSGVLIINEDMKIIFVNDLYEQITGLAKKSIIGRTPDYMVEAELASNSVAIKAKLAKTTVSLAQTFPNNKTALVTGVPIFNEDKKMLGIVVTVNDITIQNQLYYDLLAEKEKSHAYKHNFVTNLTKNIIYESEDMSNIISSTLKFANTSSTILITGETGVGKEVIANLLYSASARSNEPFIKVNCSAIPSELAESEFFGYDEGAFTGAKRIGSPGIFELANNGTVFLDEIGDLPLNMQAKLLRTLQDSTVTRIGGNKSISLNFRVITATNKQLSTLVEKGLFREDLFYRINVINIDIPPLRKRKKDIEPLANQKLNKLISEYHKQKALSDEALAYLLSYDWPGNVRELCNVMERAYLSTESMLIDVEEIAEAIQLYKKGDVESGKAFSLQNHLDKIELEIIANALKRFKTMREAANYLEIDPATLTRKCQKYNIRL